MSFDNPYTKAPPVGKAVSLGAKDPLFGFLPRKVTAKQVEKALVRVFALLSPFIRSFMPLTGKRVQPLHQTAAHAAVQEDPGVPQETPCVRTNG